MSWEEKNLALWRESKRRHIGQHGDSRPHSLERIEKRIEMRQQRLK